MISFRTHYCLCKKRLESIYLYLWGAKYFRIQLKYSWIYLKKAFHIITLTLIECHRLKVSITHYAKTREKNKTN